MNYQLPPQARIGHVHLKVSNLEKSLSFYVDLLGFKITQRFGNDAAFLSAGSYHHHIALNTWFSENTLPAPQNSPGLFHTAILYPERKDLANILQRIQSHQYPLTGAADHGVSEALYLNDPDGNGVELYWDKPKEFWPFDNNGNLKMFTKHLDLNEFILLANAY